jgi:ClpP class serine protease
VTTDKLSDDEEQHAGQPAGERIGPAQEAEAPSHKEEDVSSEQAGAEETLTVGSLPGEAPIDVGPQQLDKYINQIVQAFKIKQARSEGARSEADGSKSESLDEMVDVIEVGPKNKIKRTRKVSKNSTVTTLIKEGLEGKNLGELIEHEVRAIIDSHPALEEYEVVFLYDHTLINRTHASAVYQRLLDCDSAKNVLLVLKSPGGQVEPAYLISKLCRRKSKNKFLVCVPGEAKSAATLLSLGADEIHMGAMSELGPIDPQINDYPALAFSSALDKIAQLAEKYPGASDMLAKYLIGSGMDVQALGHYDRIAESYSQYAINLLDSKVTATLTNLAPGRKTSIQLADYFTNHYKDHNFVIDVDEAIKQLGSEIVILESDIYQACHEIHKFLESCEIALTLQKHSRRISVLGSKFILRSP